MTARVRTQLFKYNNISGAYLILYGTNGVPDKYASEDSEMVGWVALRGLAEAP